MDGELGARETGFTLIELLVAISVMAVLAIGASLSLRPATDRSDAERFSQTFESLRKLAIQGRELRGLKLAPRDLSVLRGTADGWVTSEAVIPMSRRIAWTVQGGARHGADGPDILFLPSGQTSAFSISFERGPRCETDGWSELTCRG